MTHRTSRVSVLLIVSNEAYAEALQREADLGGVHVDWRRSLFDLGSIGRLGGYDLLIADGDLGPVTGLEIAGYAATFFPELPVLLLVDGLVPAGAPPRGVAALCAKHIAPAQLIQRVREFARRRAAPDGSRIEALA